MIQKTYSYLTTDIDRTQHFYMLPKLIKILKTHVADLLAQEVGPLPEITLQFVDYRPLVPLAKSYVRTVTT